MTVYFLLTYAALITLGYVIGLAVGASSARHDRRKRLARRQVMSQLLAVASTRAPR